MKKRRYLYLSCLVLAQAHGVLLVERTARVEVMHLNTSVANHHLWRSSLCGARLHCAQLGVAWAARLHVIRVDGGVVALQSASAIVGLMNSCSLLLLLRLCFSIFGE